MTRLLRLCPAAWRQRHEAEMLDLLAQRPRTERDLVDTPDFIVALTTSHTETLA